ncbi:MAG TPA: tail protein X [Pirellulaceae bacterium]|nr:tail protein X [Pirellulaceae bacterium]HMO90881.1 tail protein X [Pirellulaceae bacterium]HMP68643.1 tail protein X [Pirellulaceae bacterium]
MTTKNKVRSVFVVAFILGAVYVFVPGNKVEQLSPQSDVENKTAGVIDNRKQMQANELYATSGQRQPVFVGAPSPIGKTNEIRPLFFGNQTANDLHQSPDMFTSNEGSQRSLDNPPGSPNALFNLSSNEWVQVEPKNQNFTRNWSGSGSPITHRIGLNDTLQSISTRYYGHPHEYLTIFEANHHLLDNPLSLPLGVVIEIPRR